MQNRRDFIKKSCTLCMGITGLGILTSQLTGCASMPICKSDICNDIISVPLTVFIENNKLVIVRNNKLDYDILLVKVNENFYNALEMKCTHQDNPISATQTGLYCSVHGSTFDLDGNVTKEPALYPLKKFKTKLTNTSVQIYI